MAKFGDKAFDVRISEKPTLSVFEAAAYTGIGTQKLVNMAENPGCRFVLYVGQRRMFKRKLLEEYLETNYSV